jgi:nucleoside-diphosphate-sugar epimerase
MKVFVTGATGAVGPHAVKAIVDAGHEVTALVRDPAKRPAVAALGATPVNVSLFDSDALAVALAGHDAIANLASALPSTLRFLSKRAWAECHRVRREGSRNVVDAAIRVGATRVIQESVSLIYPDRANTWIDESVPLAPYPAAAGNLAAESNAERFTSPAQHGIILRFGWFYGRGAAHSEQLLQLARFHISPVVGRPDGYVSSIHVADAGAAVAAALTIPAGIYNVVDDEPLTKREFADALAAAAGTSSWIRGPGRAALVAPNVPSTGIARSLRVSNNRFKTAAGWTPTFPSARSGLLEMATR